MAIERRQQEYTHPQDPQEAQPASFFEESIVLQEEIDRDSCGLEEVGTRPKICPNNPWREESKENYRPRICQTCPGDEKIWQTALEPLPQVYIIFKQGGRTVPEHKQRTNAK